MNRSLLALCNDAGTTLALAGAAAPLVDREARTISGLAVPYGPTGSTSQGKLQFAAGSLSWKQARRVKLLREHDQRDSVGVGRTLEELDAAEVDRRMLAAGQEAPGVGGLWATFHVPEGENGDRALAEAESGLRDAFSVGVSLDDKSSTALRRANGASVQGAGALREVSLVSVPAFDDARVGSVAANAELVVSSWSNPHPQENPVRCTHCHHIHAAGVTACQPDHLEAAQAALAAASAATPPAPVEPPVEPPAPAPLATAGAAAVVTGEAATYTFGADGPSLVVDAWNARTHADSEAATRVARFNAELVGGNLPSQLALAAVFETDSSGAEALVQPQVRRPLREAIDRGRPIMSRLNPVPINNATPFYVPKEGEFAGVALHTEGTAHVSEGTLTLDDATMTPRAVSGAFRMSREVIDSSNPAIDRIALRAMLRDYRRVTEARVVAALLTAAGAATAVDGPLGLDAAILGFGDDDSDEPDIIVAAKQGLINLGTYLDADGRQLISAVGPTNAPGSRRAGSTGYAIGGVEVAKAASIAGTDVLLMDSDGILVAESAVQTFRFDEIEGPGIVKLALFGYHGAAVLDADAVERYSVAAAA